MSHLVEKGAGVAQEDSRRYLYFPTINEQADKAKAAGQFIDRVF